jgi:DNA polymerase III delta prime subunit
MKVEHPDLLAERFDALARTQSGSFIFHGPDSLKLLACAVELSRRLNCRGDENGRCSACTQIAAGTYPDLTIVRPELKPSITIEQVRGIISAQAFSLYHAGGRRVIIIDLAHQLSAEAQNALLKVLEEPPASTLFILATCRPESLLATVRSRCAELYFPAGPSDSSSELTGALELNLFDRLLLAKQLVDAKVDLGPAAATLHHAVTAAVRAGNTSPADAARSLNALELFRRQLDAKVAPRVALERLMLEL